MKNVSTEIWEALAARLEQEADDLIAAANGNKDLLAHVRKAEAEGLKYAALQIRLTLKRASPEGAS